MTTITQRTRSWATKHHFAQLALLVQPLIVFRTAGEYLRLKWQGAAVAPTLLDPLFTSLAAIGVASIVSLILYFTGRERSVIALTVVGIAALIAYKMLAMPTLG
jgi:hypothetical protein